MSFNENTLRKSRIQESLGFNFALWDEKQALPEVFNWIMQSSQDQGVVRNLGRKGARFAPRAILAQLKKMSASSNTVPTLLVEVGSAKTDFNASQQESAAKIKSILNNNFKNSIHLGGGHDHIYPLLKALDQKKKKIHILNIDAHLDTRTDNHHHSGTPFRQYLKEAQADFKLYQTGIHHFANSDSTQKDLGSRTHVQTFDELQKETLNFTQASSSLKSFIDQECDYFILSLDADAIEGSIMEAVSAVNGMGVPLSFISQTIRQIKTSQNKTVFGVYEYNPLFDNLSCKGARALSALLYQYLN